MEFNKLGILVNVMDWVNGGRYTSSYKKYIYIYIETTCCFSFYEGKLL